VIPAPCAGGGKGGIKKLANFKIFPLTTNSFDLIPLAGVGEKTLNSGEIRMKMKPL
jgi:hypothetical protein